MSAITEETAIELLRAMQELTVAIKSSGNVHPVPSQPTRRQVDPAYMPGGVEWSKMASPHELREYRRNLRKQIRKQQGCKP